MDDADRAQVEQEGLEKYVRSTTKPVAPQSNGKCLNCDSKVPGDARWCDAECRDDWDYRQGRLK